MQQLSPATRHLKQVVTWWQADGNDGFGGKAWKEPTIIAGRWEEREVQYTNTFGEETVSNAIAYLAQDVSPGDYIALGDHTVTPIPTDTGAAWEVLRFNKLPDLRELTHMRKAYV